MNSLKLSDFAACRSPGHIFQVVQNYVYWNLSKQYGVVGIEYMGDFDESTDTHKQAEQRQWPAAQRFDVIIDVDKAQYVVLVCSVITDSCGQLWRVERIGALPR